ncbi:hypothetical protein FIM47_01230 [Helicobacter pylori]|nr:hypothetical protein FIM47_01230 [Helicobacter pylori]
MINIQSKTHDYPLFYNNDFWNCNIKSASYTYKILSSSYLVKCYNTRNKISIKSNKKCCGCYIF